MPEDLEHLVQHDMSEDCPVCRAQEVVAVALLPAAAAWEDTNGLPRFSVALHGAAALLGTMLQEGITRDRVEAVLAKALDDMERQIAEDRRMGGPPLGSA